MPFVDTYMCSKNILKMHENVTDKFQDSLAQAEKKMTS